MMLIFGEECKSVSAFSAFVVLQLTSPCGDFLGVPSSGNCCLGLKSGGVLGRGSSSRCWVWDSGLGSLGSLSLKRITLSPSPSLGFGIYTEIQNSKLCTTDEPQTEVNVKGLPGLWV